MEIKLVLILVIFGASFQISTAKPWTPSDKQHPVPPSTAPHVNGSSIPMVLYTSHSPTAINGTDLKTRTFYKLAMKRFPNGVVTWAREGNGTFNFIQVDNDPENMSKYKPGGEYHQDAMWEFVPVLHQGNETGWYGLINKGVSGAYMTWSPKDFADDSKYVMHMILEKNYPGDHQQMDFFLKPVQVQHDGHVYYQFKLMSMPSGVVTWSQKGYEGQAFHYVAVDHHTEQGHMMHYKEGGKWYDDTLFVIDSPEMDTPDQGEIGHLSP